ncbi:MAG TPA: Rrf2 family transcriptional regulator [Terriglobia bacterium]|jgi:Rrf2 family nitric oxide-sensitive transcriptional repressor
MQLTLHTDYAFRVLLYLGSQAPGQMVSTEEISRAYGISRHHLVRVVQTLNEHGFVNVVAGRSGGVCLAREPDQICLGEVMRKAEANLKVVECFDAETNTCPIISICRLKPVLSEATQAFLAVLDRYTLADLLDRKRGARLAKVFAAQVTDKP